MNKIVILILSIFAITACADKEEPIGKWSDNIKLSTKNVVFSATADSVSISTEGDWWWIEGITFDDSTYMYYGRDDIDLESEMYTIQEEHFTVKRCDKNTLFVKFNENKTNKKREMRITLEAGDYFDYVNIEQAAN